MKLQRFLNKPVSRFTVCGNSMFPTLHQGQDVLVWSWFYKPEIGDIVVIRRRNMEIIKRIIEINNNGIYVEGDNRDGSTDSRTFGTIPASEIVGKVVYVR